MKKNKNKAFTLVEIIAIITLLSIIFAVIVPKVGKAVNYAYAKTYEISLESMKDATKGYILKKNVEIPIGIQTRIELSDMVQARMINKIIDAKSKEACDGYVTVTLINDGYLFHPYLNCGANYKSENYEKADYVLPTITLLGDNPMTINVGETYIEPGFVASDDIDGDITSNVVVTSTINPNVPGTYSITYDVSDNTGNAAYTGTRIINVIDVTDNTVPTVTFGTNGNSTYAKSYNTAVTVSDNVAVNTSSLKYQWTISTTQPTEASFSTTFTNGGTLSTPTGVTGGYYLWILAKDTSGNTTMTITNVFNLDNIIPVITMNGSTPVTINVGDTYSDAGATANDNIDGDITSNITTTSNINPSIAGTYTVTYNVSDEAGNPATPVIRTVTVVGSDYAGPSYESSKGVNGPVLAQGMVPIKWNGSTWIDTDTYDIDWYNYNTTDKQWANVRTADGSMWVWIPRYTYKISSGWHTSTAGVIDVQFSMDVDDTRGGTVSIVNTGKATDSNGTWTNHPAFTFGTTQLTGIWIAKFEASAVEGSANGYTVDSSCPIAGDNVTTKTIQILPNVVSWRCISIDNVFTLSRNMETSNIYGWGTTGSGIDTHLMKNTEWGVAAYLSKSIYGINSEIYKNNSRDYYTGRSGGNVGGSQVTDPNGNEYIDTGFYTYDGKCASTTTLVPEINANCTSVGATVSDISLSYNASTTGNIYGIYDMSGGAEEFISAYINNNNTEFAVFANSLITANAKYKNLYAVGKRDDSDANYSSAISSKGDAIYETSSSGTEGALTSWYQDYSSMAYTYATSFIRGGSSVAGSGGWHMTGAFNFYRMDGAPGTSEGFRPVVAVGAGL